MSWHHHRRWTFALSFMLLALLAAPAAQGQSAATPTAQPVPRFNIQPVGDFPEGFFSVTLEPGESISLTAAVVTTDDSAPVALRSFATNAINAVNGGFAAGLETDERTGAATWVDFPAQRLDLGAGARVEIPFTVSVPEGTGPGQYVAALVAETDGPIPIPGMETFNQIVRSALGVTIIVPGPASYGFDIGEPVFVTDNTVQIAMPIVNTGTYLVRPQGTVRLETPDGETVATLPVEMRAVYGGLTATLLIPLPGPLAPGDYVLSATLSDPDAGVSATIEPVTLSLADPDAQEAMFAIDAAAVTPSGDPVQYADVAIALVNAGEPIPTANVTLQVTRDGQPLETYPLARNQALPTGTTTISQRYIPADGWMPGSYTFEILVEGTSLVSGADVVLASMAVVQPIVIP